LGRFRLATPVRGSDEYPQTLRRLKLWGPNSFGFQRPMVQRAILSYEVEGERDVPSQFGYTRRSSFSPTGPLSRLSYCDHCLSSIIALPVHPLKFGPLPIPGIPHLIIATGSAKFLIKDQTIVCSIPAIVTYFRLRLSLDT
jgi:hypothetical protein